MNELCVAATCSRWSIHRLSRPSWGKVHPVSSLGSSHTCCCSSWAAKWALGLYASVIDVEPIELIVKSRCCSVVIVTSVSSFVACKEATTLTLKSVAKTRKPSSACNSLWLCVWLQWSHWCGASACKSTDWREIVIESFLQRILIILNFRKLRILVDNRIANQVQRFERVQVLQLRVQLRYVIVLSVDLSDLLQFFNAT